MRLSLPLAVALLLTPGCASPPPPSTSPRPIDLAPAPSPTTPVRDLKIELSRLPASLTLDGNLREWSPDTDNPVLVAVRPEAITVGARLDASTRDGLWLGFTTLPSELPPVGNYVEVGGSGPDTVFAVVLPGCPPPIQGAPASDAPLTAECAASERARAEVEAAHARRFARWYRIDANSVRVLDEDGHLAAIPEAIVKRAPDATTLEASIPRAAFPRIAASPLVESWFAARTPNLDPRDVPDILAPPFYVSLPEPVSFEPHAALRTAAFERSIWMSFHPASPAEVEVAHYRSESDRRTFETHVVPLYRKLSTIGATEVGVLTLATPPDNAETISDRAALVLTAQGSPTFIDLDGEPLLTIPRPDGLHVLTYWSYQRMVHDGSPNSVFILATRAGWSGLAVHADGTFGPVPFIGNQPGAWKDVTPLHTPDSVGLRGNTAVWTLDDESLVSDLTEGPIDLRWRYDPKKNEYVMAKPTMAPPP